MLEYVDHHVHVPARALGSLRVQEPGLGVRVVGFLGV